MNPPNEPLMQYAISSDLISKLVNFLKRQPYEDVSELIAGLYMAQVIEVLPPLPGKVAKPS